MAKDNSKYYQQNKLLNELNESRIEIASGKGRVLRSLKNLNNNLHSVGDHDVYES